MFFYFRPEDRIPLGHPLRQIKVRADGQLSTEHFTVDGSPIEARTSLNSPHRRAGADGQGGSAPGTDGGGMREWKGQHRSNATHESSTEPRRAPHAQGQWSARQVELRRTRVDGQPPRPVCGGWRRAMPRWPSTVPRISCGRRRDGGAGGSGRWAPTRATACAAGGHRVQPATHGKVGAETRALSWSSGEPGSPRPPKLTQQLSFKTRSRCAIQQARNETRVSHRAANHKINVCGIEFSTICEATHQALETDSRDHF